MSIRRVLAGVILSLILLLGIWYLVGRHWAEGYLKETSKDWISFEIPPEGAKLDATFTYDADTITVCNSGASSISNVLLRVNDVYVNEVGVVGVGACRNIRITDLRTYTWKKIPATRGMPIRKIEAVGTILTRGYVRRDVMPKP